jgi:hypothetical protein
MRLKLTRTGGFAGITPPPMEVDTATLAKPEAQRVEALVAGAKFFDLPKKLKAAQAQPDRFQYSLSVSHPDGRTHAIDCDEEAAPPELRELLYAVQKMRRK